jgi:hypothetical protein
MYALWSIWCSWNGRSSMSSDVPEMVDQQNSWNSLVIGTYLLYLAWNVGILEVNICNLWPPTSMCPFTKGAFTLCGECYGMHVYTPDRVIIMVGEETGPCSRVYAIRRSWVYVVWPVSLSICQVMSVLAFRVTLLATLIQKVEAPEGDRWSLRSLSGWFGVLLILSRKAAWNRCGRLL